MTRTDDFLGDLERQLSSARPPRRPPAAVWLVVPVALIALAFVVFPGGNADEQEIAAQPPADAEAAGCVLTTTPQEGRQHQLRDFQAADYATNPPTSGPHSPVPAADGAYRPGATPPLGELVHSLEHGRIHFQYRPPLDAAITGPLFALAQEDDGYHALAYENTTGMNAPVAVTAWTHALTCQSAGDAQIAVMRAFRDAYIDKAPERVP